MPGDEVFMVDVDQHGDQTVVRLGGELDVAAAPALQESLAELAAGVVILDFSDVTFMDSTALAVFVSLRNRAHDHGGDLIFRGVQPPQMRLFEVTGLVQELNLDGDGAP